MCITWLIIRSSLLFIVLHWSIQVAPLLLLDAPGESTIALAAEVGWSIYGIHKAWITCQKANRGGVCTDTGWASGLLLLGAIITEDNPWLWLTSAWMSLLTSMCCKRAAAAEWYRYWTNIMMAEDCEASTTSRTVQKSAHEQLPKQTKSRRAFWIQPGQSKIRPPGSRARCVVCANHSATGCDIVASGVHQAFAMPA